MIRNNRGINRYGSYSRLNEHQSYMRTKARMTESRRRMFEAIENSIPELTKKVGWEVILKNLNFKFYSKNIAIAQRNNTIYLAIKGSNDWYVVSMYKGFGTTNTILYMLAQGNTDVGEIASTAAKGDMQPKSMEDLVQELSA